ncbi:MAG: glycosyltransferase [Pseudomonadota bacterium]
MLDSQESNKLQIGTAQSKFADSVRGHIDGIFSGSLHGWAFAPERQTTEVSLYAGDYLLATGIANEPRADVEAAGVGPGQTGFRIPISAAMHQIAHYDDGWIAVRVEGTEIGRIHLSETDDEPCLRGDNPTLVSLRNALLEDAQKALVELEILNIEGARSKDRNFEKAPLTRHGALFAPLRSPPAPLSPSLPAYLDFTRHRLRKEMEFDPDNLPGDRDHLLNWYIDTYGRERRAAQSGPRENKLRIPLASEDIDYLNVPLLMGGQPYALTRIVWWRLLKAGRVPGVTDQRAWLDTLFWWAAEEAPNLGVEDCLVARSDIDALRAVPISRKNDRFGLSNFMERAANGEPTLARFDTSLVSDRQLVTLAMLVKAVSQPHILRYIPATSVNMCLVSTDEKPSLLARFLAALNLSEKVPDLGHREYSALVSRQGFNLEERQFATQLQGGHRLHAAVLGRPAMPATGPVDVQLIGPLSKASGLGQATRLSQDSLEETGLSLNVVDFCLDNPAPRNQSDRHETKSLFKRARVNLIHLNAESLPLVYAYAPDVFSDAYNIAYVFWELDRPAPCHKLGLELIDEVWVSSDYGRDIYHHSFSGPVTNVGMAVATAAEIELDRARSVLRQRYGWVEDTFVMLATFDSYSFVQRKNPIGTLAAFERAFPRADFPNHRLILKTQNRDHVLDPAQLRIWSRLEAAMAQDPRITLINETMPYDALLKLKAGADAYISLHTSEGWGFGMIEAMQLGVPVVATGYSGNMEFCSTENSWLVDYELQAIARDDYIFTPEGARWAAPDVANAAAQMRALWSDKEARDLRTASARRHVEDAFSTENIAKRYGARLNTILSEIKC